MICWTVRTASPKSALISNDPTWSRSAFISFLAEGDSRLQKRTPIWSSWFCLYTVTSSCQVDFGLTEGHPKIVRRLNNSLTLPIENMIRYILWRSFIYWPQSVILWLTVDTKHWILRGRRIPLTTVRLFLYTFVYAVILFLSEDSSYFRFSLVGNVIEEFRADPFEMRRLWKWTKNSPRVYLPGMTVHGGTFVKRCF